MKIAYLITTLSYGGAERQLLALCSEIQRSGHEVVVGSMKSNGELANAFRNSGIQVKEFDMRSALHCFVFFRVRKWLKEQSPAIAHTHLFKADVYGGLAAMLLDIPVVCTKHNPEPYLKNPLFSWLAREVAKRCKSIIAVSSALRIFLIETARFPQEKIRVIPLGINSTHIPQSKTDRLHFGVVGRLTEQKGHAVLLSAFAQARARAKNLQLSIFGTGPLEKKLKQLVSELKLDDCVQFHGVELNQDEMYRQFDVLILPSLWEGAGLVLLEAMAHGIPMIASDVGGTGEYVTSDCGLLVPPGNDAALTAAILRITEDAELRKQMSIHCTRRATQFAFENTLRSHLKLYQEIHNQE